MTLPASAQCAIRCQSALFRAFLKSKVDPADFPGEEWPAIRDKNAAAIAVRHVLNLDSRRELDEDAAAARRWHALEAEFLAWEKG